MNDRPHIGHAYTTIAADVIARYYRAQGFDVIFQTGTDENSQKTVEAAAKANKDIELYLHEFAQIWRSTWDTLGISYTDFIRTTEERHKKTVNEIWRRLNERGDIYKGKYKGLYCKGHEAFMKKSELVGGLCPDHKTAPEKVSEENYFFRLSKYQKQLLAHYDEHPDFVVPEARFHEVRKFVKHGLEDISISRESQRWGIPVPNETHQTIYVWFDALINYASVIGLEEWGQHPADLHVVGKDITRFHAVIWPAMLISAGLALPKQIAANGFFTIDGVKISKSLGNSVDPMELAKTYGTDALRYFLLREIPFGEDGDFSVEKFKERYNADLANGLGNLVARLASLGEKCGPITLKNTAGRDEMPPHPQNAALWSGYHFSEILMQIWKELSAIDKYINDQKLWEQKGKILGQGVAACVSTILYQSRFLEPFMPDTVATIREQFVMTGDVLTIKKTTPLFPRIA